MHRPSMLLLVVVSCALGANQLENVTDKASTNVWRLRAALTPTQLSPPFNSVWYPSSSQNTNITVSNGVLRWDKPKHFSTIFTYLSKPMSLEKSGDKVTINTKWRSSGSDTCSPECTSHGNYCQSSECQATKCEHTSVSCLAGTGDFRIALLDTTRANGTLHAENWCPAGVGYGDMTKCLTSEPFKKMTGYDFRIFPHLTAKAKHEPGQVPCSIYRKTDDNLFGKHPRLGEWGCFGAPKDEWTSLSLVVHRSSSDEFTVSMEMNGVKYEAKDKVEASDPSVVRQVDAVAIGYPNGRGYSYVELGAA